MEEVELPPMKELPESPCKSWTVGYDGTKRGGHLITPIYPAVSYTHLDVYKRQVLGRSPWLLRSCG